jgi:uncharacterized membrane protein/mono/diheme cytochrome c family protein
MRVIATGLLMAASACLALASEAPLPSGMTAEDFFLQRIRPVLADQCWRCHGARKQRNGLRLDSREGVLQGGHTQDVALGHPETSRLIDAIGYEDGDLQMPPEAKLSDAQIADFATWVRLGVPWAQSTAGPDPIDQHGAISCAPAAGGAALPDQPSQASHPLAALWALLGRLHPVIVHFPIALIMVAALGEGAGFVARRRGWTDRASGLTVTARGALIVGSLGAVAAALVGWIAGAQSHFTGEPAAYLMLHRWLGTSVAVLAAGLGVWAWRDYSHAPPVSHLAFTITLALCALLVGLVGHLGGSLIYGIGWLSASP